MHEAGIDPAYKGERRLAEILIARCDIQPEELDAAQAQIGHERERWYPWARRTAKIGMMTAPWSLSLLTQHIGWEIAGGILSLTIAGAAGTATLSRIDARLALAKKGLKEKRVAELKKIAENYLLFPRTLTPPLRSTAVVERVLGLRNSAVNLYARYGQPG